jgi:hypothetical protein
VKTCKRCGEELPLAEFWRNAKNADGLQQWCKGCAKAWRKANREKMRDYNRAYERRYMAIPANRKRRAERRRKHGQRPEVRTKELARQREYRRKIREEHPNAVRLNEIKSGPCTDCGESYPPAIMELDHVRGKREFGITLTLVTLSQITSELLEEELAKCEVRCPTCHRLRHYRARTIGRPRAELSKTSSKTLAAETGSASGRPVALAK